MNVLAIETSSRSWSVAILDQFQVLARPPIPAESSISRNLLPVIQSALSIAGLSPSQLNLIAVTSGPGAFTGLRVGVTAAKTLAYALNCPLVACNSLEVLAAGVASAEKWSRARDICAIIEAQRGEYVMGRFRILRPWTFEAVNRPTIASAQTLDDESWGEAILTGPALFHWTPQRPVRLSSCDLWQADPCVLAQLAQHQLQRGISHDPFALVPEYFRPSYADEKKPFD